MTKYNSKFHRCTFYLSVSLALTIYANHELFQWIDIALVSETTDVRVIANNVNDVSSVPGNINNNNNTSTSNTAVKVKSRSATTATAPSSNKDKQVYQNGTASPTVTTRVTLSTSAGESRTASASCPPGLWLFQDSYTESILSESNPFSDRNDNMNNSPQTKKKTRRIPSVIHMTSNSDECMTRAQWENANRWKNLNISSIDNNNDESSSSSFKVRFYNQSTVHDILHDRYWRRDFPHLHLLLPCTSMVSGSPKTDLFRYLILWEFGGYFVHADQAAPGAYFQNMDLMQNHNEDDDAILIMTKFSHGPKHETNNDNNEDMLLRPSRSFMAASPRHPLVFLALVQSLFNFMKLFDPENGQYKPDPITGPGAMLQALNNFAQDSNLVSQSLSKQPFLRDRYIGLYNRSVTILWSSTNSSSNPNRDKLDHHHGDHDSSIMIQPSGVLDETRPEPTKEPVIAQFAPPKCFALMYNSLSIPNTSRSIPPIHDIVTADVSPNSATTTTRQCPDGLFYFQDQVLPESITHKNRKIPQVVHLTSKSRCMSRAFWENANLWKTQMKNHSVYLHDDAAVHKLLNQDFVEFPHLQIVSPCIKSGAALADVWRYLVLWQYGGIYADIDSAPGPELATAITADMDSFAIIERGGFLAQYFLTASPQHPFMFTAMSFALFNLMSLKDVGGQNVPITTGPRAIADGFEAFIQQRGPGARRPRRARVFVGLGNRTVQVVGTKKTGGRWNLRTNVVGSDKNQGYKLMGMINYRQMVQSDNVTCFFRMLEAVEKQKQLHTGKEEEQA